MHLYSVSLQTGTGIVSTIHGNFSGTKTQEIIVSRGKILELLKPDENGKIQTVLSYEVFGQLRSLVPFRLTGGSKDYVILGSDSGKISIVEYNPTRNSFEVVHMETFGKSGCRRIVPGQYVAVDPRGRAVMIAAVEKQKLVYILNRDSTAKLTISSPLEAHKSHTIVFSCVGVDVGFENPIFACIEVDYNDAEEAAREQTKEVQKLLTYYELDLGLNHVLRKWTDPVDMSANMLISVPGGTDGPGGVLVCSENFITYKNQNHASIRASLPRRHGTQDDLGLLMVSYAIIKQKDLFFFLVQSEIGDLYKVVLSYVEDTVSKVVVSYFDTVPVANSLSVLKTGFLFLAAEFGNHYFYQFQGIGDDEPEIQSDKMEQDFTYFHPRPLKNLLVVDTIESLSPVIDFKIADLAHEVTPQLYALCGRGSRSTLRTLRHGLAITEMAVSELPGSPSAVWSLKRTVNDEFDKYIVVSFVNATLVLSIGETVEEVSDTESGFLANTPTLHTSIIGQDGLLQIHPNGIRHIRSDKRINEWKTPGKKTIVQAAANQYQVAIALSGGELIYFELDASGQLDEIEKKEFGRDIACMDIAPIPEGRTRARFLAVGDWENNVRILSLDRDESLSSLAVQVLRAKPETLALVEMKSGGNDTSSNSLFLNIGLSNGVLLRTEVDKLTGVLSDTRTRFLGAKPVKLFKIRVHDSNAVLALSSRSWIAYNYQTRFHLTPLSYNPLEHASHFSSEQCPEGVVAIAARTLRIITTDKLGELFNQSSIPLRYTPRHFVLHPQFNIPIIIEADHNSLSWNDRALEPMLVNEDSNLEFSEKVKAYVSKYGMPRAGPGRWASCIRIIDPVENKTHDLIEFEQNEAAVSLCTCVFHDRGGEVFVVVGTAKDMILHPRKCSGGFLYVFRVIEGGKKLSFLHKTPVEDVPGALCPFQGRLLAGVGRVLRIYDLGKKKLLRKCENKLFPNFIRHLHTQGDRIIVGDLAESFHYVKYKKAENQLYVFADDTKPRWLTTSVMLDYDTMAGADKFGNVAVVRLPSEVNEEVDDDPTGNSLKWEKGNLNGAPHKLDPIINFHVGEVVSKMHKASFTPGGTEAIVYVTLNGAIGALLPFQSREDIDFFSHLEMHLRNDNPPITGRDHLSYRSYYFPNKDVIDGDLCEQFSTLEVSKQRKIAESLDRTPGEVLKKLEDFRNRML